MTQVLEGAVGHFWTADERHAVDASDEVDATPGFIRQSDGGVEVQLLEADQFAAFLREERSPFPTAIVCQLRGQLLR